MFDIFIKYFQYFVLFMLLLVIGGWFIGEAFPRFSIGYNADTNEELWVYDWKNEQYLPVDEFNRKFYRHDFDFVPADPVCRPITVPVKELSRFCYDYKLANNN